ncbi:protein tyrosine phosphatase [Cohnella sp. CFH 77786]|uniref:tyrosine-protein phosphatase n=1 Tax=Cohnella sp. CFH 77786 TaxID=2662265 RepID=UPI001C60EA22|nr:CpsB/CapC family capsule biosynthesis tyrosine phosphatase [Cohnella sp. CFH 77786]MBW5447131.1 protein tyrosine phosphatase [Cohnella sp. CFH 77786]
MIDIHCHLLPGLDDGAATPEESLALAKQAAEQGVTAVIATPHHRNGHDLQSATRVIETVEAANARIREAGLSLQVLPGLEIRVTKRLIDEWDAGELLTLASTRYMLIELSADSNPSELRELFHELKIRGLVPVIAHPERHPDFIVHPDRLAAMTECGALGQVTGHSLRGKFGPLVKRTALRMCRDGSIHLMASDAHHPERRGCDLKAAYQSAAEEIGKGFAESLKENADRLLHNLPIRETASARRGNRKWRIFS